MSRNSIDLVISTLKCSQTDLARALGVSRAVISIWKKRGIPLKQVKHVSEVTGIATFLLCPEYFPAPTIGDAARAATIGRQA